MGTSVGPQAVTELAAYLLENSTESEESNPRVGSPRMIKTRNLIIMPTANAYGYYHNTRTEHSVDPNRDFPYDSTSSCMKTSAIRKRSRDVQTSSLSTCHYVSFGYGSNCI